MDILYTPHQEKETSALIEEESEDEDEEERQTTGFLQISVDSLYTPHKEKYTSALREQEDDDDDEDDDEDEGESQTTEFLQMTWDISCSPHQGKDTSALTEGENVEEDEESKTTLEDGDQHPEEKSEETKPQAWTPTCYSKCGTEMFCFVGEEIRIIEGLDEHGAVIWPAALALCHYLETNSQQFNLVDKAVLELGAGPGLVSIVATLLGAWVTATDLPVIVSNLRANLLRNTRGRCRYIPQAAVLSWGPDVEHTYPKSSHRYDYVLAADVVFSSYYLDKLLFTMRYFCRPGTTIIWANKVRSKSDLEFTEDFKSAFNTTLLAEVCDVKIFMATCKETEELNS
ncbi:hypothetical protein UPYG_G00016420 [Umbra pygmaea]|uniref:Uncharacterized protein n=1 Tax=Umbra pygmaea TaxID=75934 RepID=A0ABD0Y739_UMBPY